MGEGKRANFFEGSSEIKSADVIGITATVPLEIVFAAGLKPVDLNNLFITSDEPMRQVAVAESSGFSHNICAWIKGIYATAISHGIKKVIAVTGGDCSNTIALGEVLARKGVTVIPFEYPAQQDRGPMRARMEELCRALCCKWEEMVAEKSRLDTIRAKLRTLDKLTYEENLVTGFENHLFLVNSSDFKGDPELFDKELDKFLYTVRKRAPKKDDVRLGYMGVPPIFSGFYEFIESIGARVVYNEVQRQFSMPFEKVDVVDQYLNYTYPYSMEGRLKDILGAVKERRLDGLIHYTQTFCYRQLYDIILRCELKVPLLTLEGDRPGPMDGRTALRIETFVEMLQKQKI